MQDVDHGVDVVADVAEVADPADRVRVNREVVPDQPWQEVLAEVQPGTAQGRDAGITCHLPQSRAVDQVETGVG